MPFTSRHHRQNRSNQAITMPNSGGDHTPNKTMINNTSAYASKKDWDALKRGVKPIHTAATPAAGEAARDGMLERGSGKYPAIKGLWINAWGRSVQFPGYDAGDPQGRLLHERDSRARTRASAGRSGHAGISPTSRPRSNASTRPCARPTRPAKAGYDGPHDANPPPTCPPPRPPTAGRTVRNNNENHQSHTH